MIRAWVFFLIVLATSQTFAQQITWGEDPRSNSKNLYFAAIGENQSGIYVLSHSRRRGDLSRFSIDRYDHQLFYGNSKNVRLKNQVLQKIQVLDKKVFFTTTPIRKRVGKYPLKGYLINEELEDFSLQKELMSIQVESSSQLVFYKIKSHPNSNRIGVFGFAENKSRKTMSVQYALYDNDLNIVLTKAIEISGISDEKDISDITIDDKGNFYIVLEKTNKDLKAGKGRYVSELVYYQVNTGILIELPITDPEFKVMDAAFCWDASSDMMILTGLYGPEEVNYQTGIFQIGIDCTTGDFRFNTFTAIPESFIEEVVGKKLLNQGVLLSHFYIKKLTRTYNGKTILIAERYYTDTQMDQFWANGVPMTVSRKQFNYDEVLVFCLDSNGTIEWNHIIRKKQTTEEDYGYFSSLLITVTPEFISLIFNEKISSIKDVVEYKIFEEGKIETKVLLPSETQNTFLIPVEGKQTGYNRSVIPITRQGEYSLIKITYSDTL